MKTHCLLRPLFGFAILLAIGGCAHGPTMTSGAPSMPKSELALIHVRQHGCVREWNGDAVHIDSFYVGGVQYPLEGDRDFLVTPGRHTFMVDYGRCVHGIGLDTDSAFFAGPFGRFEATVEPGAEYILTGEAKLSGNNAAQTEHSLTRVGSIPATRP